MDGDQIPDNVQRGLTEFHASGYAPTKKETYLDHFNYGVGWNDNEDYCLHVQARDRPWTNRSANTKDGALHCRENWDNGGAGGWDGLPNKP